MLKKHRNIHSPLLVESPSSVVAEEFRKDGFEGARSTRNVDVSNDTDDDRGRSLDDSDGFDDLLLVDFGTGLVDLRIKLEKDNSSQKFTSRTMWVMPDL